MAIKQAAFAGSSEHLNQRPERKLPEFAFIGRSNVGKSSLINSLCQRKSLAFTSATPGKTQLVNHFLINDSWYLVDLPGYGFARLGKKGRDKIGAIIDEYVNGSQEMVLLFVLLDSRLDLQNVDREFLLKMGEAGIPFSIIFTKCDKLGPVALKTQTDKVLAALGEYWEELPPVFYTSSETGKGRDEVVGYIENVLNSL